MSTSDGDHEVISVTDARAGRRGLHVFWILVISVTLAALALFLAWMWRANDLAAANGPSADRATAATYSQPSPAPTQPAASPTAR